MFAVGSKRCGSSSMESSSGFREFGCSDAALSFWENGRRFPSEDTVSRIVDAFRRIGAPASETAALLASWCEARRM